MDLTWLHERLFAVLAFAFSIFTVTSPRPADDGSWQRLHVTDPCLPNPIELRATSQSRTPHQLAQNLIDQVKVLGDHAEDLQTHYCKQRFQPEYCVEAEQLVKPYFKPSELMGTPGGIAHEAITTRAQEAYTKLVYLHMQLGIIIIREQEIHERKSLESKFEQIQNMVTILRCIIKRYLQAQGKQVTVGEEPDFLMTPSTPEGQILADILTLKQLKHLLHSIQRDFKHAHPSSRSLLM